MRNDELTAQVAEASNLLENGSKESVQLAKEVARLNKQMGALTVENNEVKAENAELSTQVSELRREKSESAIKVTKLESEIGIFVAENTSLRSQVNDFKLTQERCKSLETELGDLRRAYAQYKAGVEADRNVARKVQLFHCIMWSVRHCTFEI